jgi:hypothetical protein
MLKRAGQAASYTQNVVHPLPNIAFTYLLILLPAMIPLAAALLLTYFLETHGVSHAPPAASGAGILPHEMAALIGFAAIPLAAVPLATLGGPYWRRYAMNCVIGLAGGLAVLLFRLASGHARTGTFVAALFAAFFVGDQFLPEDKRPDAGIERLSVAG